MSRDVKRYVAACVECQTTKYSTQKPAGLLQPLPIPTQVWEDVSMDFVTCLPLSKGFTTIMVVVDRLSKYAHFVALPARFDALWVARAFIDNVVKHHGFPKSLISDRDPVFLSDVWSAMLTLSGTKLHFSTAYHPQPDGQTEVRNRGLEQYLRVYTADRPTKWANFLPWAELALNCFHNSALGMSPFRALYGRHPPDLVAAQPSPSTPPSVAELIVQRVALLVDLRKHLEKAQQRMAEVANRHRRDVSFEVGDKVLLKLQQYRQHSVAKPLSAKLARRYYGPFEVTERVGQVAYRLKLSEGARIHDVFHVSLLKPFVEGSQGAGVVAFPMEFVGSRPVMQPVRIWERRVVMRNGEPVEQVLVQWPVEGEQASTWEPLETIARRFPSLLEDKEQLNRGGVDTDTEKHGEPEEEAASTPAEMPAEEVQEEQATADGGGRRGRTVERKQRP